MDELLVTMSGLPVGIEDMLRVIHESGSSTDAGKVSQKHWARLADAARLDARDLIRRLDEMAADIPDALRGAASEAGLLPKERRDASAMIDKIDGWTARCRSALEPSAPQPDLEGS